MSCPASGVHRHRVIAADTTMRPKDYIRATLGRPFTPCSSPDGSRQLVRRTTRGGRQHGPGTALAQARGQTWVGGLWLNVLPLRRLPLPVGSLSSFPSPASTASHLYLYTLNQPKVILLNKHDGTRAAFDLPVRGHTEPVHLSYSTGPTMEEGPIVDAPVPGPAPVSRGW